MRREKEIPRIQLAKHESGMSYGVFSKEQWKRIAYLSLASREIDAIEETRLLPERRVLYQFSARGHDVSQVLLGSLLTGERDAVGAYYRSRPLLLSLGLSLEDAFASPMAKRGGFSNGRDIGVVCNLPKERGAIVIPMSGDVGSQYTPIAGWAQALVYRARTLGDSSYERSIAVAHGGDASVATNGFWSALTMATTLRLPVLFYIEDNHYGISVTSDLQTPGANIARNLASFEHLRIWDGSGSDPEEASRVLQSAVSYVREWQGPALVRLVMPRLAGHSGQDTQTYKPQALIDEERSRDPLPRLKELLLSSAFSSSEWEALQSAVQKDVADALEEALHREEPSKSDIKRFLFSEADAPQACGGLRRELHVFPDSSNTPSPEPTRINMLTAIRRTLEHELRTNPKVLVFGEDVGVKGGVHAATLGLQGTFGAARVFDTSLSEEGIIGRSVGMALCGLMPVPEIQFRKYADPATEQLNNIGTMRWRTYNRFAAPVVVRIPGGFAKCGDPWHSVSNEVMWAHTPGWRIAMPSNAEDAVGLLRSALRGDDPVIFFEHRHLLDCAWARRPYPGDDFVTPFGLARTVREGTALTVVTWGAMVERSELAAEQSGRAVEILDLRTISPWDRDAIARSVKKTRRCLVVHEDGITAGFGAEVVAFVAAECFFSLDAPVRRIAVEDIPIPYNVSLMDSVIPTEEVIARGIIELCEV